MKLSIVTPSFNQAQFIERTMRSVLNQTGNFELEYIVVDGQSTDGSVDIIRRIAEQDNRVRWLSEPDHGQSDAINKGLHLATGDVVAYLNSDDIYYSGALQQVTDTFQNSTTYWVYGCCRIINEHDAEIAKGVTWYKNLLLAQYRYWLLLIVNYISQPATFWRRSLLDKIGYLSEHEHLVMDYEYWCRLGQQYPARVIHQYLAGFRLYATSKSGQHFTDQFKEEYVVAKRFTHNQFLLLAHRLHSWAIVTWYRLFR